jgi:multicomponent Na+:H+ antiporter subunit G
MIEILQSILVLGGAGFCLIAAIGMVRFPDLYVRMHAATKAGTVGAGMTFLGIAVGVHDLGTVVRAFAAILFLFLTAPIGAHLLARAAYASGVKMWDRSGPDDLKGRYDFEHETLAGVEPASATDGDNV